ncbi:hypothetical protein Bbelb_434030 [Branchiostoma belcheri]|nr:hypothetical protein Bbelb_434030 [Branchiostoma belcheri]
MLGAVSGSVTVGVTIVLKELTQMPHSQLAMDGQFVNRLTLTVRLGVVHILAVCVYRWQECGETHTLDMFRGRDTVEQATSLHGIHERFVKAERRNGAGTSVQGRIPAHRAKSIVPPQVRTENQSNNHCVFHVSRLTSYYSVSTCPSAQLAPRKSTSEWRSIQSLKVVGYPGVASHVGNALPSTSHSGVASSLSGHRISDNIQQ